MLKSEIFKRYFLFTVALFISSLGVSCITRATLGTSPISSIPYVMSLNTWPTMGTYTFILNVILIVIQLLMLGRSCTRKQLVEIMLQVPVSVFFGLFIDLTMALLGLFVPSSYFLCLIELVVGCVILASGVVLEVIANVVMLSGELTVQIAAAKFKKEFGVVKMGFDISLVVLACIISMAFSFALGGGFAIQGVREGTVIGALLVGPIVRLLMPHFRFIEKYLVSISGQTQSSQAAAQQPLQSNVIITIAREYGSGGRQIGQQIARDLGIAFYDSELISLAANESGLSEDFIRHNEQNVANSLLFELIMQDYEAPIEKSLSSSDALFVAQSKVIRRIAAKESCVIVGRCANFILKDMPQCLNVFIYSDRDAEIKRAVESYNVDSSVAVQQVERINRARENHYLHYTGTQWRDPKNYHLMLNADFIGRDTACRLIEEHFAGVADSSEKNVG